MSRQRPSSASVRRAVPAYSIRALAAVILFSLSSMSAGCRDATVRSVYAERDLVMVGERARLRAYFEEQALSIPHRCSWSVEDAATGMPSGFGIVDGEGEDGWFTALEPGTYLVRASYGSTSATQKITAFAPTVSMDVGDVRRLAFRCFDPSVTSRGRLLCVFDGVHVFSPGPGTVLDQTRESVPSIRGLDVQGERVAVATGGCRMPGPSCLEDEKGLYLYQLGADDKLVLLSHLPQAADLIPLLNGDELYISGADRIEHYSIKDPTRPSLTGCISNLSSAAVPFMLQGRLAAQTSHGELMIFDPSAMPTACGPAAFPLSVLRFGDPRSLDSWFLQRPLVSGDLIYVSSSSGLYTIDARDPVLPRVTSRLPWKTESVAIHGGRLFALMKDGLFALDLSDPRSPRFIGRGPADYSNGSRLFLMEDKLWLSTLRGSLWRIDVR